MSKKTISNGFVQILPVIIIVILLIIGAKVANLLTQPSSQPVAPNQSTIAEISGGSYKKYTNNHFKYSFEYPSGYSLVENMEDYKDGFYRQTVLSKDANYDIPNTKFISGSIVSFWFYTDRTLDEETDKIKKDSILLNSDVTFTDSEFKGLKSIEIKYGKYLDSRKIFIPRDNEFLSISYGPGEQTTEELKKQYQEDFEKILTSFQFLD